MFPLVQSKTTGKLSPPWGQMRTQIDIMASILNEAVEGTRKTRIMYGCSLSYGATEEYLKYLLETGLLRIGKSFHTTDKGLRFLRAYQTLELLLTTKS